MAKSEDFLSEFPLPCFEKTGYLTNDYCESHVVLHSSGINPVQSTAAPVCIARGGMLDAAQQLLSQRAESSCHLAVGDEHVCVLSQGACSNLLVFLRFRYVSGMFLERGTMMLRGFKSKSETQSAK
jgi:hypothetical protein